MFVVNMDAPVRDLISRLEEMCTMEMNTLGDLSHFYRMLQDILLEYCELFAHHQDITDKTLLVCASLWCDTYKAKNK